MCDYIKLNDFIKSKVINEDTYYLFFDEVQNVNNFEKVVNSLRASLPNLSIFLTGSNSSMLSTELSTVLSGRYVTFNIYPLSFKEYIELTQFDLSIDTMNRYLKWGGLPNIVQFDDDNNIRDYLSSVFDSIIIRDVSFKLKLNDLTLFNQLLEYLIDTTGREFSSTNILNYLKSNNRNISPTTLYSYLDTLCSALVIKKVYRYDIHGKALLKTLNKYYLTDFGIAQIRTTNFSVSKTMLLENLVYNELLVRGYNVYIGKTRIGEVDFIAIKDNKTTYYQVSYIMNDMKTIDREFNAFNGINDNHPRYVLSLDDIDLSRNGIIHKNILKWLME